jgi:hypothetical protein
MYGLRKINKDGKHYDFQWPLKVGSIAIAPDWNSKPKCGGGLHLLPNAQGSYGLLNGDYWAVVEFDESKMVMINNEKAKVPECKIVYLSETTDGLLKFFKDVKFNSQSAIGWAYFVGDREYMKQFVTEQKWAYYWACDIGDQEYMKQFVTDSTWAYCWARDIGDREYMKQFVTDSEYAYWWAYYIGDREYMKQFITEQEWKYCWAKYIGDKEYMK